MLRRIPHQQDLLEELDGPLLGAYLFPACQHQPLYCVEPSGPGGKDLQGVYHTEVKLPLVSSPRTKLEALQMLYVSDCLSLNL